jgi:hypothetical protein
MTSEELSNAERARRDYIELSEAEVGVARDFLKSEGPAFALDSRLTELDAQRRTALDQMNTALELMGLTPFPWMSRDDLLLFLRNANTETTGLTSGQRLGRQNHLPVPILRSVGMPSGERTPRHATNPSRTTRVKRFGRRSGRVVGQRQCGPRATSPRRWETRGKLDQ